jgi:hypothetical protein
MREEGRGGLLAATRQLLGSIPTDCFSSKMLLSSIRTRKPLQAARALIWFNACVYSFVANKVVFANKGTDTVRALMYSLF